MSLMNLGRKRYELTYHYIGKSQRYHTVQFCNSLLDAVNLTLCEVKWNPVIFDTWIEERINDEV